MSIHLRTFHSYKGSILNDLATIKDHITYLSLHVSIGSSKWYFVQYVFEHVHLSKYKFYGGIWGQSCSWTDGLGQYFSLTVKIHFQSFIF